MIVKWYDNRQQPAIRPTDAQRYKKNPDTPHLLLLITRATAFLLIILHLQTRPTEHPVMFRNVVIRKKVRCYSPPISSVTFVNLSGCYIQDTVHFKDLLAALVHDFSCSGDKTWIRCEEQIFLVIAITTSGHYK